MIRIKDVIALLEDLAPPAYQESYDNAGLITGDSQAPVKGVMLCLDSTEQVVDEAAAKGCNLVIAHHPIIFGGLKKITGKNYVERTVIKAIRKNIAVYAIHTNLDHVPQGVNSMICRKLGLVNCRILSPKPKLLSKLVTFCPHDKAEQVRKALFEAGAGVIGNYGECSYNLEGTGTFVGMEGSDPYVGKKGHRHAEPETRIETIFPTYLSARLIRALIAAHPYEEAAYDIYPLENLHPRVGAGMIGELPEQTDELTFLKKLKKSMKTDCIRHTELTGNPVKTIAVCGGAGVFLLKDAVSAGAGFLVTADVKYHQFFDAEGKIVLADIGHYESEQFTKELIYELLKKNFSTFAIHLSVTGKNPVNYF